MQLGLVVFINKGLRIGCQIRGCRFSSWCRRIRKVSGSGFRGLWVGVGRV